MALHEKIAQMANSTQKNFSVLSQMSALTDIIHNLENIMNANGGTRGGNRNVNSNGTKSVSRGEQTYIDGPMAIADTTVTDSKTDQPGT